MQQFKDDIQKVTERPPIPGKISGQLILPKRQMKPGIISGGIRPRGIEGGDVPEGMEAEMGEIEIPTEGEAPELQ